MFTTNNKAFINGKNKKYVLPITYEKEAAEKCMYNKNKLGYVDALSFGSKIGFITNCSTYWYSLLANYPCNSVQYKELVNRLKCCRKAQGQEIDKTKGIKIEQFPVNWYNVEAARSELDKELVVNKKPYFQKYIYPALNRKYKEFLSNMETYSLVRYGIHMPDNKEEQFVSKYNKECPINDSGSVVNVICHYLESQIKEIKSFKQCDQMKIDDILINYKYDTNFDLEQMIMDLFKEYKQFKQNSREVSSGMGRVEKKEIKTKFRIFCNLLKERAMHYVGNKFELANIVVYTCYGMNTKESKEFAWDIFGEYLFQNVVDNTNKPVCVPVRDNTGGIEYLGMKFSLQEVNRQ